MIVIAVTGVKTTASCDGAGVVYECRLRLGREGAPSEPFVHEDNKKGVALAAAVQKGLEACGIVLNGSMPTVATSDHYLSNSGGFVHLFRASSITHGEQATVYSDEHYCEEVALLRALRKSLVMCGVDLQLRLLG